MIGDSRIWGGGDGNPIELRNLLAYPFTPPGGEREENGTLVLERFLTKGEWVETVSIPVAHCWSGLMA